MYVHTYTQTHTISEYPVGFMGMALWYSMDWFKGKI